MEISRFVLLVEGKGPSLEYFCCSCRQLRLALDGYPKKCGNCGNKDLIMGCIGTLDKDALIRHVNGFKE